MNADPRDLPSLPRDEDGPVFAEPWQAQAFALALALHQAGYYTWSEWAAALSAEILAAQRNGDDDLGDTYYLHWLNALESLCQAKFAMAPAELVARKEEWHRAFLETPHGQPVELKSGRPREQSP